jgi:uncharacterized protein (DUF952 family)
MSQPNKIYHIAVQSVWDEAVKSGVYEGDTLRTEGFIHCSTGKQVEGTANRYYSGRTDMVLLEIDPAQVAPEIRYEGLPGRDVFPHIYGPLDTCSVVRVHPFKPAENGSFHWQE